MYNLLTNRLCFANAGNSTLAALTLMLAMLVTPTVTRADFAAVGDVTSSLGNGTAAVNEAGGTADDLIIGDTGVGGLLADGAAPFIGTLTALESNSVILGNEEGSVGAANIEDFIPGGNWVIDGDLVVGHAGQGFLDFLNAAGVQDAPSSVILGTMFVGGGNGPSGASSASGLNGNPRVGTGTVRVNGLGSNLTTQELVVGGAGVGLIEASGRSQIFSQEAVDIGSVTNVEGAFGDGTIRLTDLGTRWSASEAVRVGGTTGTSVGRIQIQNEAVFQVDNVVSGSAGTLTINPRGFVELSGRGTLRMLSQTGNAITNNGIISGDGFIDGTINIGTSGELRNAAGVANDREYLLVSETVTSAGLIESQGGEMEFMEAVTNTGTIVARDAIMRFRGSQAGNAGTDLTNNGNLILGEATTVYGTIAGTGTITTIGPGTTADAVTINGNVTFDPSPLAASMDGELAASSAPATGFHLTVGDVIGLTINGDLNLGGNAELAIDYVGDETVDVGDVLPVISVTGNILGSFANSELVASGRSWDIDILGNDVIVTAGSLVSGPDGDFDNDGDVDGSDFLYWQRNLGDPTTLANWQNAYNGSGAPLAGAAAVPEPSTMVLTLLALVGCPRRRSRS